MTSHDEFCWKRNMDRIPAPCLCDLIARVRADERSREAARLSPVPRDLRADAGEIVDAVKPLIWADLYAQVEALETFHNMVWKQDVLALIDGGE